MGLGEDRISELSDTLLLHIFSFLPTKSVVSTCVLSKRWRYVYTPTPILDFSERKSFSSSSPAPAKTQEEEEQRKRPKKTEEDCRLETERFMNFVDKLLPLSPPLHDVILPSIQKFGLCVSHYFDKSRVIAWIITLVTRRKVEQLSLQICIKDFVFPPCFFTSETLTMLKLNSYVIHELPESISFPSLKILCFKSIEFMDENMMEKFISSCPVLEELSLKRCIWMGRKPNICISAPALKCLIITGSNYEGVYDGKIKIHAPILLSLVYKEAIFKDHFLTHSFSSILDANIDFSALQKTYKRRLSAGKLLAGVSNVKLLKLSNETFEVLSSDDEPLPNLPTFCNLIHLEVTTIFYGSRPLVDFLRITPNLESLVFDKGFYRWISDKDHVWEKKSVPEYLLLNLKVIEFREFYGIQRELLAIKYFLKNSSVLEKMTILSSSTLPKTEKNKVMKKLLKFRKGSTSCVVNLS